MCTLQELEAALKCQIKLLTFLSWYECMAAHFDILANDMHWAYIENVTVMLFQCKLFKSFMTEEKPSEQ